jgi:hypothetical protein
VSEGVKNLRNVAIILLIAAAVDLLPGGGTAARTFTAALWVLFGIGIAFIALRLYREHRVAIYSLGDAHRALLYGGIALGMFLWAGRVRMWQTSLGELAWWVLLGGVIYAAVEVVRRARAY